MNNVLYNLQPHVPVNILRKCHFIIASLRKSILFQNKEFQPVVNHAILNFIWDRWKAHFPLQNRDWETFLGSNNKVTGICLWLSWTQQSPEPAYHKWPYHGSWTPPGCRQTGRIQKHIWDPLDSSGKKTTGQLVGPVHQQKSHPVPVASIKWRHSQFRHCHSGHLVSTISFLWSTVTPPLHPWSLDCCWITRPGRQISKKHYMPLPLQPDRFQCWKPG